MISYEEREEVRMTASLGFQLDGDLLRDMQCYPPIQPARFITVTRMSVFILSSGEAEKPNTYLLLSWCSYSNEGEI